MKEIVFYYDIVCPFAYMASRHVESVAARNGARVKWTPVLLGGLYKNTNAPQGKDGSASDAMSPAKKAIFTADFQRQIQRYKVPITWPSSHPQRTISAMRLLAVSPTDKQTSMAAPTAALEQNIDNSVRRRLSMALYRAYWCDNQDLTDEKVLSDVVSEVGWSVDVKEVLDSSTVLGQEARRRLEDNTNEATERGAFGVPSFWVNDRLFWGIDRLHFVEQILGNKDAHLPRLMQVPHDAAQRPVQKLTVFFDFSSPWTFLGVQQIPSMLDCLRPLRVEVEWVPVLLGAIFKAIGSPNVPMQALSPAKAAYAQQDLQDWLKFHSVFLKFTSHFPLRTVLPLRVYLAEPSDKLRSALFAAAWQKDRNIGDREVLRQVLQDGNFNASHLLGRAEDVDIKEKLKQTTSRALSAGVCGVPSFQVNNGPVLFGQDRINVAMDMLCGWTEDTTIKAKL